MTETYELPLDRDDWTAVHWLVAIVQEAGDLETSDALSVVAVLLANPGIVMAAYETSGTVEVMPSSEGLTNGTDYATVPVS